MFLVVVLTAYDGRIVTFGQLVLFSTETGDAWLLDTEDQLATRIAQDGDPLPVHIEDTATSFAVEWKGNIALRVLPSSVRTGAPVGSSAFSATPPNVSRSSPDREISNMFG